MELAIEMTNSDDATREERTTHSNSLQLRYLLQPSPCGVWAGKTVGEMRDQNQRKEHFHIEINSNRYILFATVADVKNAKQRRRWVL